MMSALEVQHRSVGQTVKDIVNDSEPLSGVGRISTITWIIKEDSTALEICERAISNDAIACRSFNPHGIMKGKSVYDPPAILQVGSGVTANTDVCSTHHYRGIAGSIMLSPYLQPTVRASIITRRKQHGIASDGI